MFFSLFDDFNGNQTKNVDVDSFSIFFGWFLGNLLMLFLCLDDFNENPNKHVDGDNVLIIFVITIMIFVRKKKAFRSVAGSVSHKYIMYLIHFYVIYRFTGTLWKPNVSYVEPACTIHTYFLCGPPTLRHMFRQDGSGIENSARSNVSFPFHGTWCRVYFVSTRWFPLAHWTPSMARRRPQVSCGTPSMSQERLHPLLGFDAMFPYHPCIFCKMPCGLNVIECPCQRWSFGIGKDGDHVFLFAQVRARKTRAVACEAPRRMRRSTMTMHTVDSQQSSEDRWPAGRKVSKEISVYSLRKFSWETSDIRTRSQVK